MKTKTSQDDIDISLFRKNNCDKWMRYEDDITKYYYPQILDWINSKERKHSQIAFTSGLGRNIARLIETAEAKTISKTREGIFEDINQATRKKPPQDILDVMEKWRKNVGQG